MNRAIRCSVLLFFYALAASVGFSLSVGDARAQTRNRVNRLAGLDTASGGFTATTSALDLYVSPSGSDTNDCTASAPCLTIDAARRLIPRVIRHPVVVRVAAGTYAAGAVLSSFAIDYPADPNVGAYLQFAGTCGAPTLTSGATSGIATGATGGSGKTWGTLTMVGAGWTAGDLRGKFVEITAGAGAGQRWAVADNTADTITIAGTFLPAPAAGSSFSLLAPTSVITGNVVREAVFDRAGLTIGASSATIGGSFAVQGVSNHNPSTTAPIMIDCFRFTGVRALFHYDDSIVALRFNRFEPSASSSSFLAFSQAAGGLILTANSGVLASAGTTLVNGISGVAGFARRIQVEGNVIDGFAGNTGTFVQLPAGASLTSRSNSVRGILRVLRVGTVLNVFVSYDKYQNCGENCIYGNAAAGSNTSGSWQIAEIDAQGFGTAAVNPGRGPVIVQMDDLSGTGSTGSSAAGCAFRLQRGVYLTIRPATAITGAACDFETDDATVVSYAAVRAAVPKRIANVDGTVIREQ